MTQFTGPAYSFGIKVNPNDRPGKYPITLHLCTQVKKIFHIIECETRSVTPTSELAEKQIDIDQAFAKQLVVTRKTTKTLKNAQKRA